MQVKESANLRIFKNEIGLSIEDEIFLSISPKS